MKVMVIQSLTLRTEWIQRYALDHGPDCRCHSTSWRWQSHPMVVVLRADTPAVLVYISPCHWSVYVRPFELQGSYRTYSSILIFVRIHINWFSIGKLVIVGRTVYSRARSELPPFYCVNLVLFMTANRIVNYEVLLFFMKWDLTR